MRDIRVPPPSQEHIVCQPCLDTHSRTAGPRRGCCPSPGGSGCPAKAVPQRSLFLERQLTALRRRCPNVALGCQAVYPQERLTQHLTTQCDYRIIKCQCGDAILASQMRHHESEVCPNASVSCARYEQGCRAAIKRKDDVAHARECNFYACVYRRGGSGCPVLGSAATVAKHEKDYCIPLHTQVNQAVCRLADMSRTLKQASDLFALAVDARAYQHSGIIEPASAGCFCRGCDCTSHEALHSRVTNPCPRAADGAARAVAKSRRATSEAQEGKRVSHDMTLIPAHRPLLEYTQSTAQIGARGEAQAVTGARRRIHYVEEDVDLLLARDSQVSCARPNHRKSSSTLRPSRICSSQGSFWRRRKI